MSEEVTPPVVKKRGRPVGWRKPVPGATPAAPAPAPAPVKEVPKQKKIIEPQPSPAPAPAVEAPKKRKGCPPGGWPKKDKPAAPKVEQFDLPLTVTEKVVEKPAKVVKPAEPVEAEEVKSAKALSHTEYAKLFDNEEYSDFQALGKLLSQAMPALRYQKLGATDPERQLALLGLLGVLFELDASALKNAP